MHAGSDADKSVGEILGIAGGQYFLYGNGGSFFLILILEEIVISFPGQDGGMGAAGESGQGTVDVIHGARTIQTESQECLNSHFPKIRFGNRDRCGRFNRIDFLRNGLFKIVCTEGCQVQILLQIDIFSGKQRSSYNLK